MLIIALVNLLSNGALLMMMLTQVRPWFKTKISGRVIQTTRLSLLQRIEFHRSTLMALALGVLVGRAGGWLPESLAIFTGGMVLAILLIPMNYTFTTQGVAIGQAIFRPWKEFSGISKKANQVILDHPSFLARLTLFVRPAEFENVLVHINKHYQ